MNAEEPRTVALVCATCGITLKHHPAMRDLRVMSFPGLPTHKRKHAERSEKTAETTGIRKIRPSFQAQKKNPRRLATKGC